MGALLTLRRPSLEKSTTGGPDDLPLGMEGLRKTSFRRVYLIQPKDHYLCTPPENEQMSAVRDSSLPPDRANKGVLVHHVETSVSDKRELHTTRRSGASNNIFVRLRV